MAIGSTICAYDLDAPDAGMNHLQADELMKLAEVDPNGFGATLGEFGTIGGLCETDPLLAQFFGNLYPNKKAFFGAPILIDGEAVGLVSMLDTKPRPDWLSRKFELEEVSLKAGSIIKAGPSAAHSVLGIDVGQVTKNGRQSSKGSTYGSTCASDRVDEEFLALIRSQLSALSQQGASPQYCAALSKLTRRQLTDLVDRPNLMEHGDTGSLWHALDLEHLRALTELGSRDDHVIRAFEDIVMLQRDTLNGLDDKRASQSKLAHQAPANVTLHEDVFYL